MNHCLPYLWYPYCRRRGCDNIPALLGLGLRDYCLVSLMISHNHYWYVWMSWNRDLGCARDTIIAAQCTFTARFHLQCDSQWLPLGVLMPRNKCLTCPLSWQDFICSMIAARIRRKKEFILNENNIALISYRITSNHIFLLALAAIAMQHLPTAILPVLVHVQLVDLSEDFARSWQLISCWRLQGRFAYSRINMTRSPKTQIRRSGLLIPPC